MCPPLVCSEKTRRVNDGSTQGRLYPGMRLDAWRAWCPPVDGVIRVLIGVIAIAVGLTQAASIGRWAYVADAVGLIRLLIGLAGRCPLYAFLGMRTCKAA